MKKLCATLLVLVMCLSLMACSPSNGEQAPSGQISGAPESSVQPGEPEADDTSSSSAPVESETAPEGFAPKDVSDESISSIRTYGDYLIMYKMIVDNYFSEYEEALKGTLLYSEESFQEIQEEYNAAYEEQKELYADMIDQEIIGKDSLVEFLISYRDSLKEVTDALSDIKG